MTLGRKPILSLAALTHTPECRVRLSRRSVLRLNSDPGNTKAEGTYRLSGSPNRVFVLDSCLHPETGDRRGQQGRLLAPNSRGTVDSDAQRQTGCELLRCRVECSTSQTYANGALPARGGLRSLARFPEGFLAQGGGRARVQPNDSGASKNTNQTAHEQNSSLDLVGSARKTGLCSPQQVGSVQRCRGRGAAQPACQALAAGMKRCTATFKDIQVSALLSRTMQV